MNADYSGFPEKFDVRDLLYLKSREIMMQNLLWKTCDGKKKISGGFSAEMGGLDEMVFTGTIGEDHIDERKNL
jgi:acetate kinase